jgi:hypothetical protein
MTQNNSQQVGMSQINNTNFFNMMASLSIVLFSQIIDNVRQVKRLFFWLEIGITLTVLFYGG